jgi:PAS domain S-box-containing protein
MPTILVVDDHPENQYLLQALLSVHGYTVIGAAHGALALELALQGPPDLVVSDVMMPVMDGFQLCRVWKEHPLLRRIPFVIYTATYTDAQDEQLALSLGADAFIIKPTEPADFIKQLDAVLARHQAGELAAGAPTLTGDGLMLAYNAALLRKLEQKIQEQETASRRLQASEERFRLLAEQAQDLIYRYRLGPEPGFEYISPSATLITGYTPEEHYADPLLGVKLVHPDDRHLLERAQREPEAAVGPLTLRWLRKDGTIIWTEQVNRVISDEAGRPLVIEGIARDITERKRAEEEQQRSTAQLQDLSRRLVEAHERERRALARELHDEVGQVLTGLKLTLGAAATSAPPTLAATLADAQAALNELMGRVRALSLDLRPALLDDLGLLPALGWYLERYTQRTGVQVALHHQGIGRRFSSEVETVAYRTIQEALTNVARHAETPRATVRLRADRARLMLRIDDPGRGFDHEAALAAQTTGGLSGMRERVLLIGGVLTIESAPGEGTQIVAELPLPQEEATL